MYHQFYEMYLGLFVLIENLMSESVIINLTASIKFECEFQFEYKLIYKNQYEDEF